MGACSVWRLLDLSLFCFTLVKWLSGWSVLRRSYGDKGCLIWRLLDMLWRIWNWSWNWLYYGLWNYHGLLEGDGLWRGHRLLEGGGGWHCHGLWLSFWLCLHCVLRIIKISEQPRSSLRLVFRCGRFLWFHTSHSRLHWLQGFDTLSNLGVCLRSWGCLLRESGRFLRHGLLEKRESLDTC